MTMIGARLPSQECCACGGGGISRIVLEPCGIPHGHKHYENIIPCEFCEGTGLTTKKINSSLKKDGFEACYEEANWDFYTS